MEVSRYTWLHWQHHVGKMQKKLKWKDNIRVTIQQWILQLVTNKGIEKIALWTNLKESQNFADNGEYMSTNYLNQVRNLNWRQLKIEAACWAWHRQHGAAALKSLYNCILIRLCVSLSHSKFIRDFVEYCIHTFSEGCWENHRFLSAAASTLIGHRKGRNNLYRLMTPL